ncbi:MAG: sodium-dependent transporter, partial [Balneolaceae bacterium]
QLFNEMTVLRFFAILLFMVLSFAELISLNSMIELAAKVFIDMGIRRRSATAGVCIAGFIFGLPSSVNLDFFANQDFVWGIGLMMSGAFMSFAVIKYGPDRFRKDLVNTEESTWKLGRWWSFVIKYIVPVQVISLLGWWIYLSATVFAPDTWYNPLSPFSVATVIVQWGIVLGLFRFYNKSIARKTSGG